MEYVDRDGRPFVAIHRIWEASCGCRIAASRGPGPREIVYHSSGVWSSVWAEPCSIHTDDDPTPWTFTWVDSAFEYLEGRGACNWECVEDE
jgi:hypothetical protein